MANRYQSELGTTGECSPNLQMVMELDEKLQTEFDHIHHTITHDDSYLFLTLVAPGTDAQGNPKLAFLGSRRGCNHNLCELVARSIIQDPVLLVVFQEAILLAAANMDTNNLNFSEDENDL